VERKIHPRDWARYEDKPEIRGVVKLCKSVLRSSVRNFAFSVHTRPGSISGDGQTPKILATWQNKNRKFGTETAVTMTTITTP
jgi:hypothetical protein